MLMRIIALIALLYPSTVFAVNGTTTGTLTTVPNFDVLWVKTTYTGDDNNNNSFVLEYKLSSSSEWLAAYSPAPDRRGTVAEGVSNTANQYQFRAGIFGLTEGGVYDVRVTYSDADGVTGGPTLSTTATLLSSAIVVRTTTPMTYYMDDVGTDGNGSSESPWNNWTSAFSGSACGDKLILRDGTYPAVTVSKACSATDWYEIEAENTHGALFTDADTQVLYITGNYVKVTGIKIPSARDSGVRVGTNVHHVWLDNLYLADVDTNITTFGHAGMYGINGIKWLVGVHNLYITRTKVLSPSLTSYGPAASRPATCCDGIGGVGAPNAIGVFVFKENTIDGTFRDGIGNTPEDSTGGANYSQISDNIITGPVDDTIQMEGADINLAVIGNAVISDDLGSCFGAETVYFGPAYWVRNTCASGTLSRSTVGWKSVGMQNVYLFHNSIYLHGNVNHECLLGGVGTTYIVSRNNIYFCNRYLIESVYTTGEQNWDFDIVYNPYSPGASLSVKKWYISGVANEYSFTGFQGIAQEIHGHYDDPLFDDPNNLTITSASRAKDNGIGLANINTPGSKWPFRGAAPDIGAKEYSRVQMLPTYIMRK